MLNGLKIFAYLFYKNAILDIKMLIDFFNAYINLCNCQRTNGSLEIARTSENELEQLNLFLPSKRVCVGAH